MRVRKADARGVTEIDWLTSYHTFSFDQYYEPSWKHFGPLRVINDDIIAPSGGFGAHPHRDMEIITFIISGELEHKDSLGTGSVIRPFEIQKMSAGSGITHSEFNHSKTNPVHLLQIWIFPRKKNLKPQYHQINYASRLEKNRLLLLASEDGRDATIPVDQNMTLHLGDFVAGEKLGSELDSGQKWLQLISGKMVLNKENLEPGDGVGVEASEPLQISCETDSKFLIFNFKN